MKEKVNAVLFWTKALKVTFCCLSTRQVKQGQQDLSAELWDFTLCMATLGAHKQGRKQIGGSISALDLNKSLPDWLRPRVIPPIEVKFPFASAWVETFRRNQLTSLPWACWYGAMPLGPHVAASMCYRGASVCFCADDAWGLDHIHTSAESRSFPDKTVHT